MINNSAITKSEIKHFSSFSIFSYSFLRRLFIVFLVIIIAFTSSFKATEKETHAFLLELSLIVGVVSGLVLTTAECYRLYKDITGEDSESCDAFFDANTSVDNNGNYQLSDDAVAMINKMIAAYEKEVTYQDCYFANNYNLPADWFQTKKASDIVHEIIKNNPDKMFSLSRLVHGSGANGGWYVPDYGYTPMVRIRYTDVAYAAVSTQDADKFGTPNATLYDDNWESTMIWHEFIVFDGSDNSAISGQLAYTNSSGEYVVIKDKDSAIDFDLSLASKTIEIGANSYLASLNPSIPSAPFHNLNPSMVESVVFTASQGAIPVFVSESAMKKGTADGVQGQYMPNYTGQPITNNTITSSEINNYVNNYNNYYGSGSGGGGSGDNPGSGSGNWLDSLLNALGNFGNIIMTLVSKVVEIITDIVKFFTDTLSQALDIIPSGFVGFLGALFPFIPKEWKTAVSLMLALLLIGTAIKVFRK